MPELSSKVSKTQASDARIGKVEAEARLQARKKSDSNLDRLRSDSLNDSGSKIGEIQQKNVNQIPIEINQDPNRVVGSATRDSMAKEATSNFIGDFTTSEEEVHFVTGSSYKGSWDALGMTGVGRYVMPNGTVYEGEMRDGMFHGHGSLYWSKNQRLDVVHLRGKLKEHKYTFADDLSYEDEDWSYCKFPDRRFYESTKKGLRPGGRSLRSAKQPTKILPAGCYDAGDGVFDPKTLCVTSYDDSTKILRTPTQEECDWIVENCRKSWSEPTGYRSSLNENWSNEPPELPYNLAMSEDSPDPWWKRLTKFERDLASIVEDKEDDGYLEMPELCFCGQYVILGEPCHCLPVPVSSEIDWHKDLYKRRFHAEKLSQRHEHEEMEGEDMPFDPCRVSFVDTSTEYTFGESFIEGNEAFAYNAPEIDVPEELLEDLSSEKFLQSYKVSGKISEDGTSDEQLPLATAKSRPEIGLVETENEAELQTDAEKTLGEIVKPIDTVEKKILRRSSKVENEKNTGKPEDFADDVIPQDSSVGNQESIVRSEDLMKEEKLRKSVEEPRSTINEGGEIAEEEIKTAQKRETINKPEDQDSRSRNSAEDRVLLKSTEKIDENVTSQTEIEAKNKVSLEDVPPKSTEENLNSRPENIEEISKNVNSHAETVEEIPKNVNSKPENIKEIHKNVDSQSKNIANNKVLPHDVPPKSTEEIHRNVNSQAEIKTKNKLLSEDVPPKSAEENLNSHPENIEEIRKNVHSHSESIQEIPKNLNSNPENIKEIHKNVDSLPENIANNKVLPHDVVQKSTEEIHKSLNSQAEFITKNEDDKENHETEVSEVAIKKLSLDKPANAAENSANEKNKVLAMSRETSLENDAVTIQREKVSGAPEPETTNDRRTESKLLPKATKTEWIEEAGQDLHSHRVDAEAIVTDDVEIIAETSVKLQENIDFESHATETVRSEYFAEDLVEEKPEDHTKDDKLPNDKFDTRNTKDKSGNEIGEEKSIEKDVASFGEDKTSRKTSKSQFPDENEEIFQGVSKMSFVEKSKKSSEASKISGQQDSRDFVTRGTKVVGNKVAESSRSNIGEEIGEEIKQRRDLISDSQISSHRAVTGRKETVSIVDAERSLKDKQISLEKVHPSLASLSPKEQKLPKHNEIIEIYKKVPKKEKTKNICSTEDLRSGAALTAPRSRFVEYTGKPCDSRTRKPTTQEVPGIASPCREAYSFKISTKPDRFTDKHISSKKREKK